MPHKINRLNIFEDEYIVNGKNIQAGNIPFYKKSQTHFTMAELKALEDYIAADDYTRTSR